MPSEPARGADDDLSWAPPDAWVIAMASLPNVGPSRLRALVRVGEPQRTWHQLLAGRAHHDPPMATVMGKRPAELAAAWARAARALDPIEIWQRHVAAGVGVAVLGAASMPEAFSDDVAPPGLIFWRGDPDAAVGPRVGIVGTRDCTRYGRDLAFELAHDLSAVGVSIVSGLALGIDGAAHAGALDADGAPPIGVVGTGLDVVYPRQHRRLWSEVAARGALFSEYPLGSGAEPWHFPTRNRLIAALADVLVVVESHERGGSMHSVDEAELRQRPVMAVPGPVRSAASDGTNKLISEGASVVRDATDVLVELGLESAAVRSSRERRSAPDDQDAALLDALGWQPATFEQLVVRSGRALGEVSVALDRLRSQGWIAEQGGWYERVAKR